jgi:hypothetical protein
VYTTPDEEILSDAGPTSMINYDNPPKHLSGSFQLEEETSRNAPLKILVVILQKF